MSLLLFDVGNVIVKADLEITHRMLQDYGVPGNNAQLFFRNSEYTQFGRGIITGEEFYKFLIEKYLAAQLSYDQVKNAHNSHLYEIDPDVVALVERIPRNQLAFATNTNNWQTQREKQLIDLRRYSDWIFRSDELGMLKTDKGYFSHITHQLPVKAGEIILVDDNLENIMKAKKCGLKTVHFSDAENLVRALEKNGFAF